MALNTTTAHCSSRKTWVLVFIWRYSPYEIDEENSLRPTALCELNISCSFPVQSDLDLGLSEARCAGVMEGVLDLLSGWFVLLSIRTKTRIQGFPAEFGTVYVSLQLSAVFNVVAVVAYVPQQPCAITN